MRPAVLSIFLTALPLSDAFCSSTLHFCVQLLPPDEENVVLTLFETIKQAAAPLNVASAIAVGLAEAVAGGVGGLASRAVTRHLFHTLLMHGNSAVGG